eukprot:4265456-Amphidinium_carterae.1
MYLALKFRSLWAKQERIKTSEYLLLGSKTLASSASMSHSELQESCFHEPFKAAGKHSLTKTSNIQCLVSLLVGTRPLIVELYLQTHMATSAILEFKPYLRFFQNSNMDYHHSVIGAAHLQLSRPQFVALVRIRGDLCCA